MLAAYDRGLGGVHSTVLCVRGTPLFLGAEVAGSAYPMRFVLRELCFEQDPSDAQD